MAIATTKKATTKKATTKKATTKKATTKKATTKAAARTARPKTSDEPVDRVSRAIDAAEAAAKDLRVGADKGTRDLLRDLDKTLKHARANAQRVARAVKKDLRRA